jgi:hypothetical protein
MNNRDDNVKDYEEPLVLSIVGKIFIYLLLLTSWFFIGGFFSVGPRIAHNIDNAVGTLALDGAFISWAVLPVTCLIYLINSNAITSRIFIINLLVWLLFLALLYIRWDMAYQ